MEKKCKDLVKGAFNSRMKDIRDMYEARATGRKLKDLPPLNEYGLSLDYVEPNTFTDQKEGYKRYQISWGGPSEEFRMYGDIFDEAGEHKIEFWYLDWYDGAHVEVKGKNAEIIKSIMLHG